MSEAVTKADTEGRQRKPKRSLAQSKQQPFRAMMFFFRKAFAVHGPVLVKPKHSSPLTAVGSE